MLIIRDSASPPEELSIRFFNESLQIAFPNNVLVSKFHDECRLKLELLRERLVTPQKRGAGSAELIII